MNIEIMTRELRLDVHGFGATAAGRDYAATAFRLSGKTWEIVRSQNIKNKGKNIWIYDSNDRVFAGVELENDAVHDNPYGLESTTVVLRKYGYFRHVGPYGLIKQVGQNMSNELSRRGFEPSLPYIEIYGHWTNDETKLETELLMSLK